MRNTADDSEPSGVRHLRALAASPRAAGSADEARARTYAASTLERAGFEVRESPFEYSAFPGTYGTPLVGVILGAAVAGAALSAQTSGRQDASAFLLVAGVVLAAAAARWMLGDGVLRIALMRARSVNLVATRRGAAPAVWLVAHLDTKSQPVPSALRVTGVVVLSLGVLVAVAAEAMTLAGWPARTSWWVALVATIVGAVPVVLSVVGNRSSGAVDNASGVAAVLAAAELLNPNLAIGVLIPSAEELGLAGARAWARGQQPAMALNCDGVDDDGSLLMMYRGQAPAELVRAIKGVAPEARLQKMPLGLLTDSVALSDRGWRSVTVSHGSMRTLRRVHTRADSLDHMKGTSIDRVARVLARAAEELAQ